MTLLDSLGRLFTLPQKFPPLSGDRLKRFQLFGLSNRELRKIAGTTSHYSKRDLVDKIMQVGQGEI